MKEIVQSAFEKFRCSAVFLKKIIDVDGIYMPHNTIYGILWSKGLTEEPPKKRKRRKWIKFGKAYSNSIWHTNRRQIEDDFYVIRMMPHDSL